jgi:hypothetical protein
VPSTRRSSRSSNCWSPMVTQRLPGRYAQEGFTQPSDLVTSTTNGAGGRILVASPATTVVRSPGRVAELADAQDSGSCVRKDVGVQVPPRPPRGLDKTDPVSSTKLGMKVEGKSKIVSQALWVPRTSSVTLNWAFLQNGCDGENGPWPSRSSISPSSGPCRSSAYNGPTAPTWPSKSSCSATRWPSFDGRWPALFCDRRIERSLPASAS